MSRSRGDGEARVCLQDAHIRLGWPDFGMTSESAAFGLPRCQTYAHTGRCIQTHRSAQPRAHMQQDDTKTGAHTFLDTCGRLMTAVCTRVCTQTHVCTSAEQRTLLDYFNSVSLHWFRGLFLKYHSYSQQARRGQYGVLCTLFNGKLDSSELRWFVFGWWSISRCSIFRLYRPAAGAARQRLIVLIKIARHRKSRCSRSFKKETLVHQNASLDGAKNWIRRWNESACHLHAFVQVCVCCIN